MFIIRVLMSCVIAILVLISYPQNADAFCGFYVAKADAKLYNKASQVIIARNDDKTILTMANDFQGNVKDFAIVVPVPVVIKEEQVNIGENKIIQRLDAFSAPRLVEYFDPDPCRQIVYKNGRSNLPATAGSISEKKAKKEDSLGVTIEAKFSVGEYDILVLSAKESNGLETWLNRNSYKIPQGASQLLKPYIKQGMKFFVAKVNLEKFNKSGYEFLRPIQIAYQTPKFMLPIRLGMINAQSEQDLIVYILSPKGQAELTNYRQVNVPSNAEIPLFVKGEFSSFYKSMFAQAYNKESKKVGFLEYAWNMASCDPCSAEPLNTEELKKAGVFWLNDGNNNVFITRLHVRYTRDKFPEDLMFEETSNQNQFQGRYVLNHPFKGKVSCEAGKQYQKQVKQRFEREAQNLAKLTGWKINDIRKRMQISANNSSDDAFWQNIWDKK